MVHLVFSTARNVQVRKHLQDVEIEEESSAVFSCELSHDDEDVEWFLNGTLLYTNNFNDIRNIGNCYTLTMKQVKPEDAGTVTMKSDKVTESVRLKVIGELWLHSSWVWIRDVKEILCTVSMQ